jgi:CubicO group peptidase (beta-lactamase class C family)
MALVVRRVAAVLGVSLLAAATLKGSPYNAQAAPTLPASPDQSQAAALLADAAAAATELDRIRSLLVSWRGSLVLERYYNGARAATPANIKSAAKSVISAVVGIAIDRKAIASVHQPIADYFPSLNGPRVDPRKRAITIEDLLTMRSGLESTSNRYYGAWVQSANWVQYALDRPLLAAPGTAMDYSTGSSHLLSAILTKATGKSTWQYSQETLAKPLGFALAQWPRDPQGIYFGGNDMLMTPRQMAAFGELYLKKGAVGGQQIVPASWVEESFVPRTRSRWSDQTYGYGWWARELAGQDVRFAWGFGGQYIFIVPALDLVVVTTSSNTVDESRRSHRRTVMDIVEQLVIDPIAQTRTEARNHERSM